MLVRRIARPLLAAVFVQGGIDAFRKPAGRAQLAAPLLQKVPVQNALTSSPETAVRANGLAMALGGAMLATGRLPRVGAALLGASIVPTTVAGHPFWQESDPQAKAQQRIHFMKNAGLLGGVMLAAVDTAGKPGLSWRAQRAAKDAQRVARNAQRTARREARAAKKAAKGVVA